MAISTSIRGGLFAAALVVLVAIFATIYVHLYGAHPDTAAPTPAPTIGVTPSAPVPALPTPRPPWSDTGTPSADLADFVAQRSVLWQQYIQWRADHRADAGDARKDDEARYRLFDLPLSDVAWDAIVARGRPADPVLAAAVQVGHANDLGSSRFMTAYHALQAIDMGGPVTADAAGQMYAIEAAGSRSIDVARWHRRLDPVLEQYDFIDVFAHALPFGEDDRAAIDAYAMTAGATAAAVLTARAKIAEVDALGARLCPGSATTVMPMPGPLPPAASAPSASQSPADLQRWRDLVGDDFGRRPVGMDWRVRMDLARRQRWAQTVLDRLVTVMNTANPNNLAMVPAYDAGRALLALAVARANLDGWAGDPSGQRMRQWGYAVAVRYPMLILASDDDGICLELVSKGYLQKFRLVLPNTFIMGCDATESDAAFANESRSGVTTPRWAVATPPHAVTITHPYWIADAPCTKAAEGAFSFTGSIAPTPVQLEDPASLSLSRADQLLLDMGQMAQARFRLPTEAEWECACRAGTTTALWTGGITYAADGTSPEADRIAWYSGDAGGIEHPIRQKRANPWGLYDMNGLRLEWCCDSYLAAATSAEVDPGREPPGDGIIQPVTRNTVLRGATYFSGPDACRAASRDHQYLDRENQGYGLRPVLDVNTEPMNRAPYLEAEATAATPATPAPSAADDRAIVLVPGAPLRWSYTVTCRSETGEALQPGHDFSYEAAPIIAALKARASGIDLVPASDGGATSAAVVITMRVSEDVYGTRQGGFNTVNASLPVAMAVAVAIAPLTGCPDNSWDDGKSWSANVTTPAQISEDQINQLVRPTADKLTEQIVEKIGRAAALTARK
jgi:hypothetical protein